MNQAFLNSTLRELQLFIRSPRFWTTFFLVVLIFVVSGPYGTLERMTIGVRLGYWLIVHAITWAIAILFSLVAEHLLRRRIASMLARMMVGSLVAALPIGFALGVIDYAFSGEWTEMDNGFHRALFALPLCALFCLLSWMTMHRQISTVTDEAIVTPLASSSTDVQVEPEIFTRLKPQNRGALIRLSVEDHYTEVVTSRGRELVLLRFADALKELGTTPGLQVHRSHWVADAAVDRLKREKGKLFVVMKDGTEIPVSRPNLEITRTRFGPA